MKKSLSVLLIAAAGLLAACGGASNDSVEVTPAEPAAPSGAVPPSATSSIQAFIAFLAGLTRSETATPLNVDGVVPPTSETATPLPLT